MLKLYRAEYGTLDDINKYNSISCSKRFFEACPWFLELKKKRCLQGIAHPDITSAKFSRFFFRFDHESRKKIQTGVFKKVS